MFFLIKKTNAVITHNRIIQVSILCIVLLSLAVTLLSSFLAGFILLGHYFLGLIVCSLLLQYHSVAFPLILDFTKQWRATSKASKDSDKACNVCSGNKCRRYLKQDKTPWKSIRVKKKLNDAMEHLFNTILSDFIESWYGEFTADATFVSSLRNSIRYSVSLAVNKIIHLDTGRIISDVLIPSAIRHIDDCLCMERIAGLKNIGIEQVAISYLGDRLHIAATNRKREVEYLRQLSSLLLPTVMPTEYMRCGNFVIFMRELLSMWTLLPLMDVLADPNVLNQLVILIVKVIQNKKSSRRHADLRYLTKEDIDKRQDDMVEILCNFGEKRASPSPFALELKWILKDTDLLYAFMQYLKKEDTVHLLQFCLNLEEFNSALLRPDLTSHQLVNLHKTASDIYNLYIDPSVASSAHIGYDRRRSHALKQLLAGGPERIVRLRTTEPLLFAAADYVYGVLEQDWLKHFFHTVDFYKYMCKRRININASDTGSVCKNNSKLGSGQSIIQPGSSQGQLQGDRSTVARISSGLGKIKGALAVRAPVVGAPFCNAQAIQIVESQQVSDSGDMSLWKVSIPTVTMRQLSTREQQGHSYKSGQNANSRWLFHVEIESNSPRQDVEYVRVPTDGKVGKRDIDIEKRAIIQWYVMRKEQDFNTLNERLTGVLSEANIDILCPLKSEASSVDERRIRYERWLRHLLAQHTLIASIRAQYSQLLHTFLTQSPSPTTPPTATVDKRPYKHYSHHQQDSLATAAGADRVTSVDLETIYQSVALRLRKEKGQHLDASFMATFLKSIGLGQSNLTAAADWADLSDAMDVVATTNIGLTVIAQYSAPHVPKTLHNHVFNDNFGLHTKATNIHSEMANNMNSVHPRGLMDSLFYLLKHVFKVRDFCLRIFAALCSVVPDGLESAAHRYIDYKIRAALNQENLTYLITQLQDVIFTKHTTATSEQLEERKRDAFKHLNSIISDRFANLLSSGGTEIKEGAAKLLTILHNPHLNKHLVYNLFDLILIQLYPELDKRTNTAEDQQNK